MVVATQKQLDANRRNGQKGGPRTEKGKMSSRWNSLTWGLTRRGGVLPDEDPKEYAELHEVLHAQYQPVGPVESELVEQLADVLCDLPRLRRTKIGILKSHLYQSLIDLLDGAADEGIRPSTALDPRREEVLQKKAELLSRRNMDIDLGTLAFVIDAAGPELLPKVLRQLTNRENRLVKIEEQLRALQSRRVDPAS